MKWSGAYVAPAVIGLVVIWEVLERRRARSGRRVGRLDRAARCGARRCRPWCCSGSCRSSSTSRATPGACRASCWRCRGTPASVWNGIWQHQRAMLDFHTELGGDHPYQSPPWSWPLLQRPVAYWFSDEGGAYREILAIGQPGRVVAGAGGARRPGRHLVAGRLGLAAAGAGDPGRRRRDLPAVARSCPATGARRSSGTCSRPCPFLCLALGVLRRLGLGHAVRAGGGAAVYGGAGHRRASPSGCRWRPRCRSMPDGWRMRMLFTDCDRPDGVVQDLPDDSSSQGVPPDGWCWI